MVTQGIKLTEVRRMPSTPATVPPSTVSGSKRTEDGVPLTEQEKVRIRHHTRYLNVAEAYTFVLAPPPASKPIHHRGRNGFALKESALPLLRDLIEGLTYSKIRWEASDSSRTGRRSERFFQISRGGGIDPIFEGNGSEPKNKQKTELRQTYKQDYNGKAY